MEFEYLGPYRIESVLGQGGMGTVYKAIHAKSGDLVAVKVIASVLADQERFRRRFAAEVETLKKLRHPNIVQLIGYGEEQGHLFYSMEFVAGESLQELLRRKKRLPAMRVIEIATEICVALKQAHDMGIIHRDLKPANIMINDAGAVKLTDFGIAKLFGSTEVTAAGAVIGTADFMPPEQAEGKPVTTRSDLYAVGSLAYAALTGRAPFVGRSVPEVLYAVRYNSPTPLETLAPDTPSELVELVEELLAKDPSQRPPTALVLANRLKALHVGLRRREETSITNHAATDAASATEMTSIDLESLKEVDPEIGKFTSQDANQTRVAGPSAYAPHSSDFHSAILPTQPPVAGPNDQTRVATPSAAEDDFEENPSSAERVVGKTRFTEVEEEDRIRSTSAGIYVSEQSSWPQWISIALMSVLLLGCLIAVWIYAQPQSADQLFAQVEEGVASNDDSTLLALRPVIDEIEERFPEDLRLKNLDPTRKEIELILLSRTIARQARERFGTSNLDAIEQAFWDCLQARNQNAAMAKTKLQALLAIYGANDQLTPHQSKIINMAKFLEEQLREQREEPVNAAAEQLQQTMLWISTTLPMKLRPNAYRGIVELYEGKPWAAPFVEQAKKSLGP